MGERGELENGGVPDPPAESLTALQKISEAHRVVVRLQVLFGCFNLFDLLIKKMFICF